MSMSIAESTASPGEDLDWERPQSLVFDRAETEILSDKSRWGVQPPRSSTEENSLVNLLCELAVGMPVLSEVQALRVWLFQPANHSIRLRMLIADFPEKLREGMELPLNDAITSWVWQHQRPLIIAAEEENRFPGFARLLVDWGIKYFCAVPLTIANRRIGVLGLASERREVFDDFDRDFFQHDSAKMASDHKNSNLTAQALRSEDNSSSAVVRLVEAKPCEDNFEGIIGQSTPIRALCNQIKVVAPTPSTVLILGETGTGKELIARATHNLSSRRDRPFIKVNCAAIPSGLIESELFGHERGAFTGAVGRRTGRFEMAHGGTLFLDEIGDIPLELQPKLLRVLQEQEFERVGGTQTTRVDVRVVAATSRDLPRMVADGEFRGDLYYRLNVLPLRVPPLRERAEDIPLLVRHFVALYSERICKCVKEVPIETMDALLSHPWPGNVRELQNVIERAVIFSPGRILTPSLEELNQSTRLTNHMVTGANNNRATFFDVQREHIIQALDATNWVLGGPRGAAVRLGLARTTLIGKMRKLGICRDQV